MGYTIILYHVIISSTIPWPFSISAPFSSGNHHYCGKASGLQGLDHWDGFFPIMTSTATCVMLMLKFTDVPRIYFILCSFSRNKFQWTDLVLYFRNFFLNYIAQCFLVIFSFLIFRNIILFMGASVFCVSSLLWALFSFALFHLLLCIILSLSSVFLTLLSAMP